MTYSELKESPFDDYVVLCGPYKFSKEMWATYLDLTAAGKIVLLPAFDAPMTKEEKMRLHRVKIAKSSAIVVVTVNGYHGQDTQNEIDYAISMCTEVVYCNYCNPKKINGAIIFKGVKEHES